MPRDLTPDENELFDKMSECAQAGSWEAMTLKELQQLETVGREIGEKNLWLRVGDSQDEKLTLQGEIAKRLEMNERARIALKYPTIEL